MVRRLMHFIFAIVLVSTSVTLSNRAMGKLLSKNQNFTAVEGTTVKLPCEADEPEETAIQWSKETENETIRIYSSTFRQIPDLRFQMNPDTYTLSIDKVNKHDSGVFTCDDGETTIVHQLSVIPPNVSLIASKSDSLIVGLVVLAILACVAIVAGVIYARKRKAQYQPANSPRR